jgi:hypothetical protein
MPGSACPIPFNQGEPPDPSRSDPVAPVHSRSLVMNKARGFVFPDAGTTALAGLNYANSVNHLRAHFPCE